MRPEPQNNPDGHGDADEAADPCQLCDRSLKNDEAATCLNCHARVRGHVLDIVELYATLPDHLAVLSGVRYEPGPRSSAESPVVGGNALVLAAAGTHGGVTGSRRGNRDHAADQWPEDPPSAVAVLEHWEDDWREIRREPAAPTRATVTSTTKYLLTHLRWASVTHPEFVAFAADMRKLRSRLRVVTGEAEARPVKTGAECFDCTGPIVRNWTDEGLSDHWQCADCRQPYERDSYRLALKSKMYEIRARQEAAGYITPSLAATLIDRSERTIREWMRRGELAVTEEDGHRFVAWEDVERMDELAGRRVRPA